MIDAHFHLWRIGENGCRWPPPDLKAIYRTFGLEEFEALARPLGVTGAVLVQSQPNDADTRYLIRTARESDFILGVCGWCALDAPHAPAQVRALAREPKLRALRPMLQDLDDERWIAEADIGNAITAMIEAGLAFDALARPRHLPALIAFKRRHDGLALIVDHGAKPDIGAGDLESWAALMSEIARLPNTYCKLSGLLAEAPPGAGADALRPYVEVMLARFGPKRVMWGGDWPVLNLASAYEPWLRLAQTLCAGLAPAEREWVFGETARSAYGLAAKPQGNGP
ncbi:amidohydrolase family protein [Amphiplicatus metriothermophilus]|uniref:L-fuconolactonase n=1 Tax=Amphiplicatus metriothermophilus TaxID=1519374 RepID=A0A239PW87_9PROT|nr:amidohydrolase family protein [Amphiplicatus metriothermophilus]MBB5519653.1 L-fuconolactonase [Amphiplicatus metriothermophilus]SNT74216.1 L-fuconolactonase [Amphiplicatus metriothermophilus]